MSGQAGARGYLLQALVCLLDSLEPDENWVSVTIEPNEESDKVDILWVYPESRKAVQVKHSTRRIGFAAAKRWAEELEESTIADELELRLLGSVGTGLPVPGGLIGSVSVPIPETTNTRSLRKQAAHNLDLFLSQTNQSLRPHLRELLVDALGARIGAMAATGETRTRQDFEDLLRMWTEEILKQSGHGQQEDSTVKPRLTQLETRLRRSHARRVARWQAAGVPRELAEQLSDDDVGTPAPRVLPNADSPLKLLCGPLGSGKSLCGERFFEDAVRIAMQDCEAPIPVFLDARSVSAGLESSIAAECGDIAKYGVCLVLDSLDELPAQQAFRLLTEARVLVGCTPNSKALLTSRPMPCWLGVEEQVDVDTLDEGAALDLITRVSGLAEPNVVQEFYGWSAAIKEAVRVPLFAVLMSRWLITRQPNDSPSRAGLVAHLVETATKALTNPDHVSELLRLLATKSLDAAGAIAHVELGPNARDLLATGLVTESGGLLSFPLPVLTQWFGARAILLNEVDVRGMWSTPGRIDRWRSTIALALATASESRVDEILKPIAFTDPGFLLSVVDEATTHWKLDQGLPKRDAIIAGRRIRAAMSAVSNGIGLLASLITPLNPKTMELFPTAVRVDDEWLIAGWKHGVAAADVVALPPNVGRLGPMYAGGKPLPGPDEQLGFTLGWVAPCWSEVRGARPGRQSAWAWRWVSDHLHTMFDDRLKSPSLLECDAPALVSENAWHTTRDVLQLSRLDCDPIPVRDVLNALPIDSSELIANSQGLVPTRVRLDWRDVDVTLLGLELGRLQSEGIDSIHPPLPPPDLSFSEERRFEWNRYSEERLFERIAAVYSSALSAYVAIGNKWFKKLAARFDRAATLPARIRLEVDPKAGESDFRSEPMLREVWEPLPKSDTTELVITSAELRFGVFEPDCMAEIRGAILRERPEFAEFLGYVISTGLTNNIYSDFAIRKLTFSWIRDDLSRIGWLHR